MRSRAGGATQGTKPSAATCAATARAAVRPPAGAASTSTTGNPVEDVNDCSIPRRRRRVSAGTSAARPCAASHSENRAPVTRPEISAATGTTCAAARSGVAWIQSGAAGQRAWTA